MILSDEAIWRNMDAVKKTLWKDLKQIADREGFRIHVIVYLRRQDKFYISNWNQNIKLRMGKFSDVNFNEFLKKGNRETRLEYYEKLERIAKIIGKENITVRRFDGGKFVGGSIYADFLQAIGLSLTDEYYIPEGIRNVGLYGNTHEIKRVLNSLPDMAEYSINKFFTNRLRECSTISGQNYRSELMSVEEIEAFLERYGSDNRKIAEEYLGEPGAELFDNTIEDLPKWQKDNPYMTDDIIRFIGTTGIYLYRENQELKKEINEAEKEIDELKLFASKVRHPFRTMWHRFLRLFGKRD